MTLTVPRVVGWSRPYCLPSRRVGRSPRPCGVRGHLVEGGGGLFADGSLGVRRIWWLLQCSHLMVPLCSCESCWGSSHCHVWGGPVRCRSLPPVVAVSGPTVIWVAPGAPGTSAHVSKSANWCLLGLFCSFIPPPLHKRPCPPSPPSRTACTAFPPSSFLTLAGPAAVCRRPARWGPASMPTDDSWGQDLDGDLAGGPPPPTPEGMSE